KGRRRGSGGQRGDATHPHLSVVSGDEISPRGPADEHRGWRERGAGADVLRYVHGEGNVERRSLLFEDVQDRRGTDAGDVIAPIANGSADDVGERRIERAERRAGTVEDHIDGMRGSGGARDGQIRRAVRQKREE